MRSESARDDRRRRGAALLVSLALHAGLVVFLYHAHPGHPFPETTAPISVTLLREPAPVAAPVGEAPAPAPAPTRPAPPTPAPAPARPAPPTPAPASTRPAPPAAREPAPVVAPAPPPPAAIAADAPAPVTPAPESVSSDPAPEPFAVAPAPDPVAIAATPFAAPAPGLPARDFARVFGEAEVDRTASAHRPIRAQYPERERRRGRESSVVLMLTIASDGRVEEVDILESGGSAFDEAALRAIRSARFRPAVLAGRPVASELRYRLRFALR